MKLTKNTRLSKKPFKANNGYAAYNPGTFDPNKQVALNEQEFGVTPSSVQTINTGVAPQGGQSALRLEGAKATPDLSGQKIDFNKSSSGSALSPKSFDYSGLATTGMAMGVGAIEKQQASLEAVGKAPSLSGEMGKGALKGASYIAPVALNPAMLSATMGLSALAVPVAAGIGAGVNYVTGNKKIKEFNTQMDAKKSLARQALIDRTNQSSQYNQLDAVNRGYSAQGSNMGFYKKGGKMSCLKGGKIYMDGGKVPGGKIVPVTSDTKLAIGKTHAQGGIRLNSNVEVENGEPIVDKGDHTLVVSNNLKNPATGNTLAKDDIKLALDIEANKNKSSQVAKNAVVASQLKREKLHQYQQAMNGDQKEPGMAEKGGKFRPINVLTKPVKKGPFLAKNGSKIRPINVLSKPYVKTPLRAQDGAMIFGGGGKTKKADDSESNYNSFKKNRFVVKDEKGTEHEYYTDSKTGRMIAIHGDGDMKELTDDQAKWVDDTYFKGRLYKGSTVPPKKLDVSKLDNSTAPFRVGDTNPVQGNTIGTRVSDNSPVGGTMEGYTKYTKPKPAEPKGDSKLRKAFSSMKPELEAGATKLGKIAAYSAPGVLDYVNQKGTIAKLKNIEVPKAKEQAYGNLAKVSMENDRAAIRKQQANYNANISGQLADSQTAALMKANVVNASMDAIAKVNQEERNQNKAISNAQTEMNLKIQDSNFAKDYAYKVAKMEKNIDLANRESTAKSKLYSDLRDVQNTFRQEKYIDKDTALKMAALDERGQRYLEATGASPKDFWKSTFKRGGKLSKLKVK